MLPPPGLPSLDEPDCIYRFLADRPPSGYQRGVPGQPAQDGNGGRCSQLPQPEGAPEPDFGSPVAQHLDKPHLGGLAQGIETIGELDLFRQRLGCLPPDRRWGQVAQAIDKAQAAFAGWRLVPPPGRGEVVRRLGALLREHKRDLAALVTVEVGKIPSEDAGEVQEMIDMRDLAVGLSRQLYGLTLASERRQHRMTEAWHPLGVVGVITSFNFPVAVWAWNAAVALVSGDPVVWKPSEKTVLTALACQALVERAASTTGAPTGLSQVVLGGPEVGQALVDHTSVALVSATGSTAMGRTIGPRVASRFGRCLLELGGNNAAIVAPSADLDLAVPAIVFAAAGTAGQRCTSLRRLIVHRSRYDEVVTRLAAAYGTLSLGNPRPSPGTVPPSTDCRRPSSPTICGRRSDSSRPPARTAGSPTSTSVLRAPRLAGPSAARRTQAAAARPARTRGRHTCAAKPPP